MPWTKVVPVRHTCHRDLPDWKAIKDAGANAGSEWCCPDCGQTWRLVFAERTDVVSPGVAVPGSPVTSSGRVVANWDWVRIDEEGNET